MNKLRLITNTLLRGGGYFETMVLMKTKIILLSAMVLSGSAWGGVPDHADGETAGADAAQPLRPRVFSAMKINFTFRASQHGNAEIVFGKTNAVGELRLSGVWSIFGFDRGAWTVTGDRFRRTLEQPANTAVMSPRKMSAHLWLDSGGGPIRLVSFSVDGVPFALSPDERAEVMSLLDPREWDAFRTVTRGDASAVAANISFIPAGTSIILR